MGERTYAQVTNDKRFAKGYFETKPTSDGALTRFSMAIALKRPQNGWCYASHCYGAVRTLDLYLPEWGTR